MFAPWCTGAMMSRGERFQVSSVQFQEKTEDLETEEAREEVASAFASLPR
jgi:hypothetical protein